MSGCPCRNRRGYINYIQNHLKQNRWDISDLKHPDELSNFNLVGIQRGKGRSLHPYRSRRRPRRNPGGVSSPREEDRPLGGVSGPTAREPVSGLGVLHAPYTPTPTTTTTTAVGALLQGLLDPRASPWGQLLTWSEDHKSTCPLLLRSSRGEEWPATNHPATWADKGLTFIQASYFCGCCY